MNPGDTGFTSLPLLAENTAQRRPGREPRRHFSGPRTAAPRRMALNEGRGVNPGDTRSLRCSSRGQLSLSLNEGRGVNPGDTCSRISVNAQPAPFAQRRPGREPRRHSATASAGDRTATLNEGRGVNPGDTNTSLESLGETFNAQRRPGREPRRHARRRGWRPRSGSLNEGRGVNPGDTCGTATTGRSGRSSLNEGRGVNPGDTLRRQIVRPRPDHVRSTKAGA